MTSAPAYPRPDFERNPLRWESLNGPWEFLFDDDDVGLAQRWQHAGLPDKVSVTRAGAEAGKASEADSITQKIAAGTQNLIKNNVFSADAATAEVARRQIQVPFVFQSPASGINDRGVHEVLWYERAIADLRSDAEKQKGHRLVARFGAVDYEATVWVNGQYVGGHRGGHVPFEVDVTDAVDASPAAGSHRLTLRVYDSAYDLTQPRGKQYWGAKPESIFYTPSGGIWQNVWLEVVPVARLADSSHGTVIRANEIDAGVLHSHVAVRGRRAGQPVAVQIEASLGGVVVGTSEAAALPRESSAVDIALSVRLTAEQQAQLPPEVLKSAPLDDGHCWRNGVALWTPEHPQLYDVTLRLLDTASGATLDEVKTTAGMRSINWTTGDNTWRLNDRPYFQALCLDQGYWPDTFMTPPSQDALRLDIELAKKMGLNGCRKHQKVEDPAFYYWADRLGFFVWGEMANAYSFSPEYVDRFNQEWTEQVKLVINRACIVTWTPVNESWAYTSLKDNVQQRDHIRALYYLTRSLDQTRSINDNCGWEHVCTDLTTFHDYDDGPAVEATCASKAEILGPKAGRDMFVPAIPGQDKGAQHVEGAPIMNTEFGGVNIAPATKDDDAPKADQSEDWGYTTATDPEDLLKRVDKLVRGVIAGGHCNAFVWTQLADIEQEVNGLYTFDRKEKLDSSRVRALMEDAFKIFYDRVNK